MKEVNMSPTVDIVFKPVCLRFSIYQGVVVYHFCADPYVQLDGMENLMGVDPEKQPIFDTNLGFLPVAHTVLVRGEKNILVDPNSSHVASYGMLARRLKELGTTLDEIDIVVNTHCHHDHSAGNRMVRDKILVVGEGELESAEATYGPEYVQAMFTGIMKEVRKIGLEEGLVPLDEGVYAVKTPGHSPGSICVLVEAEDERVAIVGDTVMFRDEYTKRALGHWYTPEQLKGINDSLDRIAAWGPTLVIPGHDEAFSTR
jgi:glyoxylase-like metal-dependent hydrolase (beta-lactamase superfamily II)